MPSRFGVNPNQFIGRHAPDADDADDAPDAEGLPAPKRIKLQARRMAGIAEANRVLDLIPAEGESLHCLCTARMDLTDVVNCLLAKLGRCDSLCIATLGYNARNLKALTDWLDGGAVGSVCLLTSKFFRSYNGALWEQTQEEFRTRKQPCACCHSHAKVITLAFASGSRFSIEGSANLCGNGSGREQFALINHGELHDFHAAWIAEMVNKNTSSDDGESKAEDQVSKAKSPKAGPGKTEGDKGRRRAKGG